MEKRIELERRARKANQITELNLDNCRSTSIVGLTDEYTALESLSLINVGLTTLKGFPKLPNLKKLELSDNRISNGINYLTTSPRLQYLNLSGNKIKDLETLKPLQEFKNLAVLDLFNNEATQIGNYREKIFEMLPSLNFLDGFDSNDVEAPSEGDDEEEVNGNDDFDDEDSQNVFNFNGLEIDLAELEEFEKRLQAKRRLQAIASIDGDSNITNNETKSTSDEMVAIDETDDLDEYLKELKLRESTPGDPIATAKVERALSAPPMNFTLLLYWFLAILNLASAAYSDAVGEDDDTESDEDLTDDEVNSDVSLDEVYNDDLEDDNSEWDEEDAPGEDDDDDVDSDEDDADGGKANESTASKTAPKPLAAANAQADGKDAKGKDGVNNAAAAAAEDKDVDASGEESQARGKKRKHDG